MTLGGFLEETAYPFPPAPPHPISIRAMGPAVWM